MLLLSVRASPDPLDGQAFTLPPRRDRAPRGYWLILNLAVRATAELSASAPRLCQSQPVKLFVPTQNSLPSGSSMTVQAKLAPGMSCSPTTVAPSATSSSMVAGSGITDRGGYGSSPAWAPGPC